MINGMTILEKTPIKEPTILSCIGVVIGILIMFSALFYTSLMENKNNTDHEVDSVKVIINSIKIIFVGFTISIMCLTLPFFKTESGLYTYKCTFEDYVTVNDITEVYEITDVTGNIWTVQDKNIESR